MATCECCGNDYDKSFTVTMGGKAHTFDAFECAIHALAPRCAHCDCVVIGHGVACYGAADRYLGLLAATLGDHDRAVEHYERALAFNRAMDASTWVAHTLYAYGRTLRIRGASGDAERAVAMLSEAAALAHRIGMPALLARAREFGAGVQDGHARIAHPPGDQAPPDDLSWREVEILRLVAAGRSNREIGEELFISGHTVANHVRNILRKTGAANRTEAAGYAYRHALLKRPGGL